MMMGMLMIQYDDDDNAFDELRMMVMMVMIIITIITVKTIIKFLTDFW